MLGMLNAMERGRPANVLSAPATPTSTPIVDHLPRTATAVLTGHPGDFIRVIEMAPNTNFGAHRHSAAQLVWPRSGAMRVECGSRCWIVSPGSAVWIPGLMPHDVFALAAGCGFRSLYLRERDEHVDPVAFSHRLPQNWHHIGEPTPLPLEPLLVAIIDALDGGHPHDRSERVRLEAVMFDRLRHCLDTPTWPAGRAPLPLPVDDRARRVAQAALDRLHDNRDLAAWGRAVGSSARTLRRIWPKETGLTFHQWRTSARMRRALELVHEGTPVSATGRMVGYTSPSAFSDAFTAHFGLRPSDARKRHARTPPPPPHVATDD